MITELEYVIESGDTHVNATIKVGANEIRARFQNCAEVHRAAALMDFAFESGRIEAVRTVSEDILARLQEWRSK